MAKSASKNASKTRGKPFGPGNPGGPGRPEGSRNKVTIALDRIADGAGKEILQSMVEGAKGGDMRAAELVLSRIWPVRKGGRSIALDLPKISTAADVVKALGLVADAVGAGDLTPEKARPWRPSSRASAARSRPSSWKPAWQHSERNAENEQVERPHCAVGDRLGGGFAYHPRRDRPAAAGNQRAIAGTSRRQPNARPGELTR